MQSIVIKVHNQNNIFICIVTKLKKDEIAINKNLYNFISLNNE